MQLIRYGGKVISFLKCNTSVAGKSDIDVMVEFSEPIGICFIGLAYEPEEIHNTKWALYPAME